VKKLAAAADHVLCLFPFEPALLAEHGVAATFVGHPMADRIPLEVPQAQARADLGLAASDTVVALLPGSRRSELRYIGPVLLEAAVRMARQRPGLRFILPVVPGLEAEVQALVAQHAPGLDLQCLAGRSHEALAACDLTLIASGTATLEAALFKRPMVITYRMHWLNWQYMRHMAYLPWVGCPTSCCATLPCRSCCSMPPRPRPWPARAWPGWTTRRAASACRPASPTFITCCARTRRARPAMRSRKSSVPEQMSLHFDVTGLVAGVDEAGRGPLAGRWWPRP
jgi:hypothetical protein